MSYNPNYQPVGTCPYCGQLVYPPNYVARPIGPFHPECANSRPKSATTSATPVLVATLLLFGGCGGLVCIGRLTQNSATNVDTKPLEDAPTQQQEQTTKRDQNYLCAQLRNSLRKGVCKTSNSGVGLDYDDTIVMVPQCVSRDAYYRVKPTKPERTLAFVGSESTHCFVAIMNLRMQPLPNSLIKDVQRVVDTF